MALPVTPTEAIGIGMVVIYLLDKLFSYLKNRDKVDSAGNIHSADTIGENSNNSISAISDMSTKWSLAMVETAKINAEAVTESAKTQREGLALMAGAVEKLSVNCAAVNAQRNMMLQSRESIVAEREHVASSRESIADQRTDINRKREEELDKKE